MVTTDCISCAASIFSGFSSKFGFWYSYSVAYLAFPFAIIRNTFEPACRGTQGLLKQF